MIVVMSFYIFTSISKELNIHSHVSKCYGNRVTNKLIYFDNIRLTDIPPFTLTVFSENVSNNLFNKHVFMYEQKWKASYFNLQMLLGRLW